jgi:uncharacterized protein with GYD domain
VPKYLFEVKYTLTGIQGLLAEGGTSRLVAATAAADSLGGTVESFYYAFGEHDVYGIVDMPDEESMAAYAMRITAAGGVTVRTVPLLTAAQVDAAAAKHMGYRPPGN